MNDQPNPDLEKIKKKNLTQPVFSRYKPDTSTIAISAITVFILIWFLFIAIGHAYVKDTAATDLSTIKNQVALDAEQQFYIAQRQGDKMQTYVQAQLVAAAYLQAKDETNYDKWKSIQDSCAHVVGLK